MENKSTFLSKGNIVLGNSVLWEIQFGGGAGGQDAL